MVEDWQQKFDTALTMAVAALGVHVPAEAMAKMRAHFEALVETNRTMNLTRITDAEDAAVRHYADSLALLPMLAEREITVQTLLDIGTGGGFPAIPLAILRPDWRITAIDSTRKKIDFVRRILKVLDLPNLRIEHARAGEWRTNSRFDLVVQRAVSKMDVSLTVAAPLLAKGGRAVAFKAARLTKEEEKASIGAAKRLVLRLELPFFYELVSPSERIQRTLHVFLRQ